MIATGFVANGVKVFQVLAMFPQSPQAILEELRLPLYATEGTAETLQALGIPCRPVAKQSGEHLTAMELIDNGKIDLVINVPREYDSLGRPDGYLIRRRAVDAGVPLLTDLKLASAVVGALRRRKDMDLVVRALDEYVQ